MPAKVVSRERVLRDQELAAVWLACEHMGFPFGPFVQLLILTGQRRTEVASLRRDDLDLERETWTQLRNKSNRTHDVPLSRPAVHIIRQLACLHAELVFPARATIIRYPALANGREG